jgi:hypothetical protein
LIWVRLGRRKPYDMAVICTMPDAAVLSAIPSKLMRTKIVLDVHEMMPELYQDRFDGQRDAIGARLPMFIERASVWIADRVRVVHYLPRRRLLKVGASSEKIEGGDEHARPADLRGLGQLPVQW